MNIVRPSCHFTRAGIFILLAVLVAFLGAAAKHSQFDGPQSHGYLSKAVKMAGARIDPNLRTEAAQWMASPIAQMTLAGSEPLPFPLTIRVYVASISVLSPPLRV